MPSPVSGNSHSFTLSLFSQSTGAVLDSPTLATGDVKVSTDGGSLSNITTLPTAGPSGLVQVSLSSSEVGGDRFSVAFVDVSGSEWKSLYYHDTVETYSLSSRTLPSGDYFNPTDDTVANVTLVGTTTTNTDMRGTDGANTVTPMASGTSQTEHDATQSTLAGLNDIAATDIVSAGAITTLSGAIVNVDLVDVTTTNTDMISTTGIDSIEAVTNQFSFTIANQVDANSLSTSAASAIGSGSVSKTITVDDGVNPIEGAAVWVSTDASGLNVTNGTLYTNTLGQVTFLIDSGSYYTWIQKGGYNFTNPSDLVV